MMMITIIFNYIGYYIMRVFILKIILSILISVLSLLSLQIDTVKKIFNEIASFKYIFIFIKNNFFINF